MIRVSFAVGALALLAAGRAPAGLTPATDDRLAAAWGGATGSCANSLTNASTCTDTACQSSTSNPGYYFKAVKGGNSQVYCTSVTSGFQSCSTDTPKLCRTSYNCTDSACSQCTTSTSTVDTNSNLGPPCP